MTVALFPSEAQRLIWDGGKGRSREGMVIRKYCRSDKGGENGTSEVWGTRKDESIEDWRDICERRDSITTCTPSLQSHSKNDNVTKTFVTYNLSCKAM